MQKFIIILLSVVLIAAGCNTNNKADIAATNTKPHSLEQSKYEGDPHPVSIPALKQRQYDGRDLKLERIIIETNSYTQHYVTYKSGELIISGIMNIPKGNGLFPVVITAHGYIDPAIYTNGRGLRREQEFFASRGYAVLHPDYRNHAQSDKDPESEVNIRTGYVEDVINAVYAVKAAQLPQINASKIALMGHSMGGGIAQAIAVAQPDLVQAYMLYAPVSSDARDSFYRWTTNRPEVVQKIAAAFGTPEQNPKFWDNVSPRNFFGDIKSPIMINHGEADSDVPIDWSRTTYEELKKRNKEVVLHTYPGEGHEFGKAWPIVMQRTLDFFNQQLK